MATTKPNAESVVFTPSGSGAVARTVQAKLRDVVSAKDFGVVGDGSTDDAVALQAWLTAIPTDGIGHLPAAGTYYKSTAALTRTTRCSIFGDGLKSRIHYTGSGVAFTHDAGRFCKFDNWYITGTSSAAGGFYLKNAQEGAQLNQLFIDSFLGAGAYALRVSSSWDVLILGGAYRQSTNGIILDSTDLGAGGNVNASNIIGADISETGIGIDFQSGDALNIFGNDFSNGGGVIAHVAAVEVGRAQGGAVRSNVVNILGNWMEGSGAGVRVGRGNTSSAKPKYVKIAGNHIDVSGEMVRLYVADQCEIGENQWGAGTITIDAGVTKTIRGTIQTVTDNSTAGQTTDIKQSGLGAPEIIARGDLRSGMSRIRVHRNAVDQTIGTGAPTKVQWTTEDLDSLGDYDNATNYRWTPTKSGWYRIRGQVTMNSLDDQKLIQLCIYKNGSRHRYVNVYTSGASSPTASIDALVNANGSSDYFEIFVEHNHGSDRSLEGDTDGSWFEGHPAV